jgi:ATP-dependent helicase/nuclease subunit B
LKLTFDQALDENAWPGVLRGRAAAIGEAWCGPLGFLGRLETTLGLGGRHATQSERAHALSTTLPALDGWWSASYEADPIGTCRRLLRDRDLLMMWGWRGEAASPRLAALWAATYASLPGVPDRVAAVHTALGGGRVDIESIELMAPVEKLEPAWQRLFERLAADGVRITRRPPVTATPTGDLQLARTTAFAATGDGSITLLRNHGPLAAANEVAAHLSDLPSLAGVLIVGGDQLLDAALHRHGLPRIGATVSLASTALVRLIIEAAFEPMEPADLHAILSMDPGPIPRRVASPLVRALSRFPSRRAPTWGEALADGLAKCEDGWRAEIAARVATLLMPAARRGETIAATEIARRLCVLEAWARGRASASPSLATLASLAADACVLVGESGGRTLVALRRLCDELDGRTGRGTSAEVGPASVANPGAVLAPVDTIVWWSFTRDSAPSPSRLRLSRREREALRTLGVTPPDLGAAMEGEAARWRRPLEMAGRRLVLVCPTTDEAGGASFPHPLWDELCAAMPGPEYASRLQTGRLSAHRTAVAIRALPTPITELRTNVAIALRDVESPSSIDRLLGCSLAWALHYPGHLRRGTSCGPSAPAPLLYGVIAHDLLARVFAGGALDAEAAATAAQHLVDHELVNLCETLALPRYQVELTMVKHAIVRSARELGRLFAATRATVRGVEVETSGVFDGITLGGRADLILAGPDVVVDLKWGRKSSIEKLDTGTALQLAAYAEMQASPHDVAYFALTSQELFAPCGSLLPARIIGTATTSDTWRGARAALTARRTELGAGHLFAPAADGTEIGPALRGGQLVVAPGCTYCELGTLCGNRKCT